MRVYRTCQQCDNEFWVYSSALEKSNSSGKFCCRKCYNEYQKTLTGDKNNNYSKITKQCPNCGKQIKVTKSHSEYYKNNFCSRECKYAYHHNYTAGEKNCNWKGGDGRGNFERVKKLYFNNNRYCAICGTTKNIHIHHIIPYRLTNDNSFTNLIPLCRSHHRKIEVMTKTLFEVTDDYDMAKTILNTILREKQLATISMLKKIKETYYGEKIINNL